MSTKTTNTKTLPGKDLVKGFTAAAQSESTRRSYAQDVRHFKAHGGKIPATAEMLAGYLASQAGKLSPATLAHRIVAIHRAHVDKGHVSPAKDRLVTRTMAGIRRSVGAKQRQVRALVKDDILELLVIVDMQKPMRAARDRALLLIGFATACRRSELVAFNVEDITPHAHGLELTIRKSKTDQEGQGQTVFVPMAEAESRCPVAALRKWLDAASILSGPLFRPVSRHDRVLGSQSLTPQSVALIVKWAVRKAKGANDYKHFSGHSLRAGFVTEAAMAGLSNSVIMAQSRHKTLEMVHRYTRPVQKRKLPSLL